MPTRVLQAWNAEAFDAGDVPVLPVDEFQQIVADTIAAGARVSSCSGRADGDRTRVTAVLADDAQGRLGVLSCRVGASWPSLAAECPSIQAFEREIFEQFGVRPEGHPWLKPLRFEPPSFPAWTPGGASRIPPPSPATTPSSASMGRRSTRSRWGRCTPASSSRATSASSATASTSSPSRSSSATSTAGSSPCSPAGRTGAR